MNRYTFGASAGIIILALLIYSPSLSGASGPYSLTGRVLAKSASPVPSAWVVLLKNGQRLGRSLTGDDGRYYISGLDRGTYEISVFRGSKELFKAPLDLNGDATFNINLPSPGDNS